MATSTLFVGNISYSMDDNDLYDAFKKFGQISEARISRDRETQRSRGFGYVTFESENEALEAVEKANGLNVEGRSLRVEVSRPREGGRDRGRDGGRENRYGGRDNRYEGGRDRYEGGRDNRYEEREGRGNRDGQRREGYGERQRYSGSRYGDRTGGG